jgi:hypothetical protein
MEKPSTARIALKWGIISAIFSIIFSTILYITDLWMNPWLVSTSYVILTICIFMSMKEYKSLNNGFLNYGEGLGLGTLLSAVAGVFSSTFNYVYTTFVDTSINQKILDIQREGMEKRGMSEEQIEQFMEISANFMSPGIVFLSNILSIIFIGFIISLIIAAIQKNTKPEIEF